MPDIGPQTTAPETLSVPSEVPLRILHVASGDLWAGAEAQILALACCQAATDRVAVAVMNPGTLATRLREAGVETLVLDESTMSPWLLFKSLLRFARSFDPDVVHTHRKKENVLGAFVAALLRKPKCVRTEHGAPEHVAAGFALGKRLSEWIDARVARWLQDGTIAVARPLADELRARRPGERVIVVPNGLDLSSRLLDRELGTSSGVVRIAFIGRLVPVKRVDLLLEALAWLGQQAPERAWVARVIGDGPLRGELEGSRNRLGLSDRVEFLGHRDDVEALLSDTDLVVLCSDHEGLPMTLLEAMARGVAVVAHRVGGMREVLESDPPPGWLVDRHDAPGYGEALLDALERPAERARRAEAARQRARDYDIVNTARSIRAFYESLMCGEDRSRAGGS